MPGLLSCHIRAVRRGGDGSCPWLRASVSALCAMGVTRAHAPGAERPAPSLLPAPSRPGRRTPSLPECTGGETEAHREAGPGLRSHPGTEVVLVPASRAPQTPPHFPEAAELGEEEPGGRAAGLVEGGGGGTPTGSGIVPGAAIQRNTGCQALPLTIVAAVVAAAAAWPTPGRDRGAK